MWLERARGCRTRLLPLLLLLIAAAVLGWGGGGPSVENTHTSHASSVHRRELTTLAADDGDDAVSAAAATVTYLLQLSEAVLAPAWSAGGSAYLTERSLAEAADAGAPAPVCAHSRATASVLTSPFTFAMFDAQLSAVHLVSQSPPQSAGGAATLASRVVGRLDLQRGCYTHLEAPGQQCLAVLHSRPAQCTHGALDALDANWTADAVALALASAADSATGDEAAALAASALTAPELLSAFMSDYLPQRAWLRTAVPRVVDALLHAERAAHVFNTAPEGLTDAVESADMRRAVAAQWGHYLRSSYVPLLQRKWALLYRLAVATLVPSRVAPSHRSAAAESVTGAPPPSVVTSCAMVDAWPRLRYSMWDDGGGGGGRSNASDAGLRPIARLVAYVEEAIHDLGEALIAGAGADAAAAAAAAGTAPLLLLRHAYCVTTTYLLALTAVVDAPFLRVAASVWVQPESDPRSWAAQTMRSASVADAVAQAATLREAAAAGIGRVAASLPARELAFITCVAAFLDAATPLNSTAAASPSHCVMDLLAQHAAPDGLLRTVWDLDAVAAVAPTAEDVPGITRHESTVPMPVSTSAAAAAESAAPSELVHWTLFSQAGLRATAQSLLFTPSITAAAPPPLCVGPRQHAATSSAGGGRRGRVVSVQAAGSCLAGDYANPNTAACVRCPSACAASATAPTPLFCPGDGLIHGCPALPAGAALAGSPGDGVASAAVACRYACLDVYQAPLHNACVSRPGRFYNTTAAAAAGDADNRSGGGSYDACVGPASLLPARYPVQSYDARVFAFVGSGVADEPRSCRFSLAHRVVSSAVSPAALRAAGLQLQPPPLFPVAPAASGAATPQPSRDGGAAWETTVQLNATLLWAMHVSQLQRERQQSAATATTTSIGHVLVALREGAQGVASQSRWSLVLISTYQHAAAAASGSSSPSAAPPTAHTITLQLLLNISMATFPAGSGTTAASDSRAAEATSPTPSSLTALSAPWQWSTGPVTALSLTTAVYRVVLSRAARAVIFYADAAVVGAPVVVDWPLWQRWPTAPSSATAAYLSVSGWAAALVAEEQWAVMSPPASPSGGGAWRTAALPLHFDYVPGVVVRLSSAAVAASPLQAALAAAEAAWVAQAAAVTVPRQLSEVAALDDVVALAQYISAFPAVTAAVSAVLSGWAARRSVGLDGVCRSGYGGSPCVSCPSGAYATLEATPRRNTCACIPQRVSSATAAAAACVRRRAGPAAATSHLRTPGPLELDLDAVSAADADALVAGAGGVPLGWYSSGGGLPETASLTGAAGCTYGLTVPRWTSNVSLNLYVLLQYTTGLGAEQCRVMATSRGRDAAGLTQPTYTPESTYATHWRAPPLAARSITLANYTRLNADQTVLTIGVRDHPFLADGAVASLLQMRALTEHHLAFLAYMLRCATVSAVLRCGPNQREVGRFSWAGGSALDSPVLQLKLSDVISEDCILSLTVRSAAAAASEAAFAPFASWPHSYLAADADPSLFFEASAPVDYVLRPSAVAAAAARRRYDPLREGSSLAIAFVLLLVSVCVVGPLWLSMRPPSLLPRSWRPYERAQARRSLQHLQQADTSPPPEGASG
ncbi:hypothetical protein NESM_000119000 [Novymonas esmeraldas]|uniref:Uncharacterized protein n=1 Tax=Novymonas esmeraldas TaxID=1808958 RepID=A0AAW0F635_9TRYP